MIRTFTTDTQIDLQLIDVAADNETVYGAGVDMAGYAGVIFIATVAPGEEADYDLKVQQDSASNFGTAADLAGTKVDFSIATETDGFAFVEVKNPKERYVRPALVVPNVGSARAVSMISIRYGKQYLPETNTDGELHVSPAEGTA